MVSFAEMLEAYGAQNDPQSLFSEVLANAPSAGMQAPLDRDKALISMKIASRRETERMDGGWPCRARALTGALGDWTRDTGSVSGEDGSPREV